MAELVKFAVEEEGGATIVILTVKGDVKALKDVEGVTLTAGTKKAPTTLRIANDNNDALYAAGAALDVTGEDIEFSEDDSDYFDWFKSNFVTVENGGGFEPESEEEPAAEESEEAEGEEEAEPEEEAEEPAEEPEPEEKPKAKGKGKKAKAEPPAEEPPAEEPKAKGKGKKAKTEEPAEEPKAKGKGKKAKAEEPVEEPKAKGKKAKAEPKPKKERPVVEDTEEHKDLIESVTAEVADTIAKLVATVGAKRARTILTRAVGRIGEDGTVADGKKDNGSNFPLFFVPGRVLRVTKRHKDFGPCEYGVECLADGSYKIVEFSGERKDVAAAVKKGVTFKNAFALLQLLTGKDNPGTMLYRFFGLEK